MPPAPLPGQGKLGKAAQDGVLRASIIARETEIRAAFREQGRSFKGMAEVWGPLRTPRRAPMRRAES